MSSGSVVTFTDPRRFGVMDLLTRESMLPRRHALGLGPEPLSPEFDAAALARACARRRVPLKVALLDQRVVAGLGNIYAVEALHLAGLSPHATGLDHCDDDRQAAPGRRAPGGCHQEGAHHRDRAPVEHDVSLGVGAIPCLRPRGRSVPDARLHRRHPTFGAGRPLHLRLPHLPTVTPRPACRRRAPLGSWRAVRTRADVAR